MSVEIWKVIEEFPNYSVSNLGNVKNIKTGNSLNPSRSLDGYEIVPLSASGKKHNIRVHRALALAFIPNPENKTDVDHIDRIRHNNVLSNLRWATKKENAQNKTRSPIGVKYRRSVWKCDKKTGERLELFESTSLAAKSVYHSTKNKAPRNAISSAAKGCVPNAYGYKWEYDYGEFIEGETWREIPPDALGFPSREKTNYHISDMGRLRCPNGFIRIPYTNPVGYLSLSIEGHLFYAHRIVALTFLEKIPGKPLVNHIDGDKGNCNVYNLEFVTHLENNIHARDTGLNKQVIGVCQYDLSGRFIKRYTSISQASKALNVSQTYIYKGLYSGYTSAGFQWMIDNGSSEDIQVVVDSRSKNNILQYSLSGEFIQEYSSAREAAEKMGVSVSGISRAAREQGTVCAHYQWRTKYSDIKVTDLSKKLRNGKTYMNQTTLDGNLVMEYSSISQAAVKTGFDRKKISKHSTTGTPYEGYIWKTVPTEQSKKRKREE